MGKFLYLVRHGESTSNATNTLTGHFDAPLTDVGRAQAAASAPMLSGLTFDTAFSSDLSRAVETGNIMLPGVPLILRPDIREVDLGNIVGMPIAECLEVHGDAYRNARKYCDYSPFGGESFEQFSGRANAFLDEVVRERGNNFSAGQRQLISFARTIVHKPAVMILDEATANIDTETEVLIQDSLERMMNIGTMLMVAHRLSTIQHADNIIVLSHGRIVEQGNHQALLAQKGSYYRLYTLQIAKQTGKISVPEA